MNWRDTTIHIGKKAGTKLGALPKSSLEWWVINWFPNDDFCKAGPHHGGQKDRERGARQGCKDCILRLALSKADDELFQFRTRETATK